MLETEDGRTTLPFASGACRHKLHPSKTPELPLSPIMITVDGIVIVVRLEQPKKALLPIELTEAGMAKLTEDRATQLWKAKESIEITEDGIVIEVREPQP